MKLRHTRRIIDAIHNGELARAAYETTPIFNLHIPKAVTDVPDDILTPDKQWSDKAAFNAVRMPCSSLDTSLFIFNDAGLSKPSASE